jgi:hypothetical protein
MLINVKRKNASADDGPEDCYWAATAKEQDGFLLVFMGQVEEGKLIARYPLERIASWYSSTGVFA